MKKFYNFSIVFIINVVLALPMISLIILKYILKMITKLLNAMKEVVRISISFVLKLEEGLVETLSV